MKKSLSIVLTAVLLACLTLGAVFAGGEKEKPKEEKAATTVTETAMVGVVNYATLMDYTQKTGNKIGSFSEAPMLAALVKAGKLPPVAKRLPEEPMVVKPKDAIGKYGGSIRAPALGPTGSGWDIMKTRAQNLLFYESDFSTIVPNVAKGWDFSGDAKSLTLYLRKGMKWSDGTPLTADDIMFTFEDILLNDDLTPVKPGNLSPGGELFKIVKIDDYTFRLDFAVPYPPILSILPLAWNPILLYPKAYLQNYHLEYNSKAEEQAKKAGYDSWWSWFNYYKSARADQVEINRPSLDTWVLKSVDSAGYKYFERNPYYFKIDTAGNQLPYIDEQVRVLVENREMRTLKIVSGEVDFAGWDLPLKEFTLYKENEQTGNYRVMVWPQSVGGRTTYDFNLGHEDPVLREIFNDVRFRQALSVAVDRDELNKVLAYGKAVARQAAATPDCTFYESWMGEYFAQYDPDQANKLLDEMGLEWDKQHEFRLRPDGKTLEVTIESQHQVFIDYSELVKENWDKVGVKTTVKKQERTLIMARREAGEIDVGVYYLGESIEALMFQNPGAFKILQKYASRKIGKDWENWIKTGGTDGIEPPEDVKRLYDTAGRWQQTIPASDEYKKLGKEMLTIFAKGLWSIGVIGMPPIPIVIANGLENTPTEGAWQGGPFMFMPYQAEQWYWNK